MNLLQELYNDIFLPIFFYRFIVRGHSENLLAKTDTLQFDVIPSWVARLLFAKTKKMNFVRKFDVFEWREERTGALVTPRYASRLDRALELIKNHQPT